MTRFIHDKFAKDYLEMLLKFFGMVRAPRRVSAEELEIDVWFEPARQDLAGLSALGCLGRMAATNSIFEPFRNAVSRDEIGDCLLKWLLVKGEVQRQARRERTSFDPQSIPKLWVLSPTVSRAVLSDFSAVPVPQELPGFYSLGNFWQVRIVAIHQLPRIQETLWLRVLGRDNVQKRAIDELEALDVDNPFRQPTLELLYNLRRNLESRQDLDVADRELIMRLTPLYQQEREQLQREAEQRGEQRGITNAKREVALNLLRMGMNIDQVSEATSLTLEELTQLGDQSL